MECVLGRGGGHDPLDAGADGGHDLVAEVLECNSHRHLGGLIHLQATGVAILSDGALAEDVVDVDHFEGTVEPAADDLEQRGGEAGSHADEGDRGIGGVGGMVAHLDEALDVGSGPGGDDRLVDKGDGEASDDQQRQGEHAPDEDVGASGVLAGAWVARCGGGPVFGRIACDGSGGSGNSWPSSRGRRGGLCGGGFICRLGCGGAGRGQRSELEIVERSCKGAPAEVGVTIVEGAYRSGIGLMFATSAETREGIVFGRSAGRVAHRRTACHALCAGQAR